MFEFDSKLLGRMVMRTQVDVTAVSQLIEPGIEEIRVTLSQADKADMPQLDIGAQYPILDIQHYWQPGAYRAKGLELDWSPGFESKATTFAPVGCLYNTQHENRLTVAVSEAVEAVRIKMGVHEEDSSISLRVRMFHKPTKPVRTATFVLRVDTRPIPYYNALADVSRWWESFTAYQPSAVPALAREAMYSTWYSFHQQLKAETIENQCRIAREFGCKTVIVDDGWQTEDAGRGYAYCGDWQICKSKMGDMRAHVARVHALGMKYMLWYSVPYVGIYSKAYERFRDMFLYVEHNRDRGILDPRFPEVREYLINIYERAILDWDIDGFKLDFVDKFLLLPGLSQEQKDGQDYISVQDAVDRLFTDIMARLKAIKPDIMIEFRQDYIGPCMRKYGNIFRVGDCPNNALTNRMGVLDLRLLSGETAIHSDMLMWNPREPVESAALQLINIAFSVPQFSMDLTQLSPEHLAMSKFWLDYYSSNREVLLSGHLRPLEPENMYPLVYAETVYKHIVAVYQPRTVQLETPVAEIDLINGAMVDSIIVRAEAPMGTYTVTVRNCMGTVVSMDQVELTAGLHEFTVPKSGMVCLTR